MLKEDALSRIFLLLFVCINLSLSGFSQLYLPSLTSKAEFDSLSGPPLANKYGNVKAVKIVYDIKYDSLYYIKKYFSPKGIDQWTYIRLGFDVEFKLDGKDMQLYFKQIRPYND